MAQTQNPEFLETRSVGRLLFEFSLPAITAAFVMATYNLLSLAFSSDSVSVPTGSPPLPSLFRSFSSFLRSR